MKYILTLTVIEMTMSILAFPKPHFFYVLFQVENSFSVSVPIFKQFHKNIIGKGGANIKKVSSYFLDFYPFSTCLLTGTLFLSQIREETNTKIDLPAENSNSEMIVITGKKANCEAAKNRILAIQKELVRVYLFCISVRDAS